MVAIVVGDPVHPVSGELVGLLDQAMQVVAGNAVEHSAAVSVGMDESGQAESSQVL